MKNTQQAETMALRLRLVRGGYVPLPLFGKRPPMDGWGKIDNITIEMLEMWARVWPDASNTGVLTRLVPTLDLDILNEEAVRAVEEHVRQHFEERGYILPRIGKPPKRAIPFRTEEPFAKVTANVVAPNGSAEKIEFLGDGQQVVVAGMHPETRRPYGWHGGEPGEIARNDLPYIREEEAQRLVDEIVEILVHDFNYQRAPERPHKRRKGNGVKGFIADIMSGPGDWQYLRDNIHEGRELHDSLRDLAAKLIASGMAPGAVVNDLRGAMTGSTAPHDDRWQTRYESIPRLVDGAERLRDAEADDDANNAKPDAGWSFHCDEDPAPTAWLIKYILPETGAGLISGQWGTYKTTVVLDVAVSTMTGTPFAGRYTVKRPGGVAYLALEGVGGLASRLTAIARTRGSKGALPFVYRSDCPALTTRNALDKLVAMVEHAAKEIRDRFDVPTVLIVIDTVVIAAGYSKSGDDNDAAVAQHIMGVLSGLSKRTGALVIGIDHFGKVTETGTRGSSAKEGHADAVLALLADRELNGTVTNTRLAVRKVREGVAGLEIPFTPKTIEVGTDPDGDPITRIVIDWNAPQPQPTDKGWSKSLLLLRRILMTLLIDGQDIQPFLDGPTVRACNVEHVRAEFCKQYPAEGDAREKAATRRMAFLRALKGAQDSALIMIREIGSTQFVWLTKKEKET